MIKKVVSILMIAGLLASVLFLFACKPGDDTLNLNNLVNAINYKLKMETSPDDEPPKVTQDDIEEFAIENSVEETGLTVFSFKGIDRSYVIHKDLKGTETSLNHLIRIPGTPVNGVTADINGDGKAELLIAIKADGEFTDYLGRKSALVAYRYDGAPEMDSSGEQVLPFFIARIEADSLTIEKNAEGEIHIIADKGTDSEKELGTIAVNGSRIEVGSVNAVSNAKPQNDEELQKLFHSNSEAVISLNDKKIDVSNKFIFHAEDYSYLVYFNVAELENLTGQKINIAGSGIEKRGLMTVMGEQYVSSVCIFKYFDIRVEVTWDNVNNKYLTVDLQSKTS